ncbi:hypothetical protein FB567DRAFT_318279 [Paraphoma chrysanthemicola]|uniref:F-box domain-containing protein n=1 Tax=Paraphoma chrysanthemicola TaxID=798071 RepID=A0A8K0VZU0_9PLEO|nr:hypothetical protein FB567DRAFT_318279 [Paraphoma chrysanthemicola]
MASLLSLPNELLEFVTSHIGFQDKVNLIKTCRTTRVAITPGRYRALVIDMKASETEHQAEGAIRQLPFVNKLLSILIKNVDLAKNVRSLQVRTYYTTLANVDLSEREAQAYSQLVEKHCPLLKAHWKEAVETKCISSAVLSLLLLHCPRLERLMIPGHLLTIGGWLQQLLLSLTFDHDSILLRKLSTIKIATRETMDSGLLQAISEWLVPLPSLQTIVMSVEDDHVSPSRHSQITHATSATPGTLSTLRILRTGVQYLSIVEVLKHTPCLSTLVVDTFRSVALPPDNLGELQTGLSLLKTTLTHFVLRIERYKEPDNWAPSYGEAFDYGKGLGSLRSFTALTTLEIALIALIGHENEVWSTDPPNLADYLPPNLRCLTLSDDLWDDESFHPISALPTMAVLKRFLVGERLVGSWHPSGPMEDYEWAQSENPPWIIHTPHLAQLNFDIDNGDGCNSNDFWKDLDSCEALQAMCESQGILCSIRRKPSETPPVTASPPI